MTLTIFAINLLACQSQWYAPQELAQLKSHGVVSPKRTNIQKSHLQVIKRWIEERPNLTLTIFNASYCEFNLDVTPQWTANDKQLLIATSPYLNRHKGRAKIESKVHLRGANLQWWSDFAFLAYPLRKSLIVEVGGFRSLLYVWKIVDSTLEKWRVIIIDKGGNL